MISPPYYSIIIFLIVVSYYNVKLFYYRINNLLFDHENMWAIHLCSYIIIFIYYYMIILLCYFLICWYSHIITLSDTFSIIIFAPGQFYITDLELLSRVPSTEFPRTPFPCSRNKDFRCFPGPRPLGPRPMIPLGPTGP